MKVIKLAIVLLLMSFMTYGQDVILSQDKTTQKIELKCNAESAFKLAFLEANSESWTIVNATPTLYVFSAKTPGLMKRWDDDVNVMVEANDSISTITVKSKLTHKPNVEYISAYLNAILEKKK